MDRRTVLLALAGLASGDATSADALRPIDPEGARRIGEAYLRSRRVDLERLRRELLPAGWNAAEAARLRELVAADFRTGRLFIHKGWRLSDTEGRLFALAALTAA